MHCFPDCRFIVARRDARRCWAAPSILLLATTKSRLAKCTTGPRLDHCNTGLVRRTLLRTSCLGLIHDVNPSQLSGTSHRSSEVVARSIIARCTIGPRRAYSRSRRSNSVDRRNAPLGLAELGRVDIVNQREALLDARRDTVTHRATIQASD